MYTHFPSADTEDDISDKTATVMSFHDFFPDWTVENPSIVDLALEKTPAESRGF